MYQRFSMNHTPLVTHKGKIYNATSKDYFDVLQAEKRIDVPAPTEDDPETKKKLEDTRAIERRARGRASTVLTGGQGLTAAPSTAKRILLGA